MHVVEVYIQKRRFNWDHMFSSLKLTYSNFKSSAWACVCSAVLGCFVGFFLLFYFCNDLSFKPMNPKVSANNVAEV